MSLSRRLGPTFLAVAALLALAAAVERLSHLPGLDPAVERWVVDHRPDWPAVTAVLRVVTRFGDPPIAPLAALTGVIALVWLARRGVGRVNTSDALLVAVALFGGWAESNVLKPIVRRARPPAAHRLVVETNFSFPSTHSVFAATFFTLLAFFLVRGLAAHRRGRKALAIATCVTLALVVGLSRVWLGVHYLTDVVAGLLIGSGWALTLIVWERFTFPSVKRS